MNNTRDMVLAAAICVFVIFGMSWLEAKKQPAHPATTNVLMAIPVIDRIALSNALSVLKTDALILTNVDEIAANQKLQETIRRTLNCTN